MILTVLFSSFSRYDAQILLASMYHRRLFVSSEADNSLFIRISDARPRGGFKTMTLYLDVSSLQNTKIMNILPMKYSCLLLQCIFEFLGRYLRVVCQLTCELILRNYAS